MPYALNQEERDFLTKLLTIHKEESWQTEDEKDVLRTIINLRDGVDLIPVGLTKENFKKMLGEAAIAKLINSKEIFEKEGQIKYFAILDTPGFPRESFMGPKITPRSIRFLLAMMEEPGFPVALKLPRSKVVREYGEMGIANLFSSPGGLSNAEAGKIYIDFISLPDFPILSLLGSAQLNAYKTELEFTQQLFQFIDASDFPIENFYQQVNTSQGIWLPKLKQFSFDQDGVCASLIHFWFFSNKNKYYKLLIKLVLCPENLCETLLKEEIIYLETICKVGQGPSNYDPNAFYASVSQLNEIFKKNAQTLGIDQDPNLMDCMINYQLVYTHSFFYTRKQFTEGVAKIPAGRCVALASGSHRMGFKVEYENNRIQYIYNNPNSPIKVCYTPDELFDEVKKSLEECQEDTSKYVSVTFRSYRRGDIFDMHQDQYFDTQALVNEVANAGLIDEQLKGGQTRLYLAIINNDREVINELLKNNANPNLTYTKTYTERDGNRKTYTFSPLSFAASTCSPAIVKLLLEHGAKLGLGEEDDLTMAINGKQIENAKLIIKMRRDEIASSMGNYIALAKRYRLNDVIKSLVESTNSQGMTAVIEAAKNNNSKLIDELIVLGEDKDAVKNAVDENGMTALMHALRNNNYFAMEVLLASGVDTKAKDLNGLNAFMHAAIGSPEMVLERFYNKYKPDIHAVDNQGMNALTHAISVGRYDSADYLANTLKLKVDHPIDANGKTPFMRAVINGNKDLALKFLKYNADINHTDIHGMTALMHAVLANNETMIDFLLSQNGIDSTILCGTETAATLYFQAFNGMLLLFNPALFEKLTTHERESEKLKEKNSAETKQLVMKFSHLSSHDQKNLEYAKRLGGLAILVGPEAAFNSMFKKPENNNQSTNINNTNSNNMPSTQINGSMFYQGPVMPQSEPSNDNSMKPSNK